MEQLGFVGIAGWVVALSLVLATIAARWSRKSPVIIAFGSLVPWLLLLAATTSVVLLASRHTVIGVVNAGIVVVMVLIRTAPNPWRHWTRLASPPRLPTLRILSANLLHKGDARYICSEIEDFKPDVVLLQELTPAHLARVEQLVDLKAFPWRVISARPGGSGIGLWSRLETRGTKWWYIERKPQLRTLLILNDGTEICFYGVHLPTPIQEGSVEGWRAGLADLRNELEHETATRVVVAGDFNATWDHGPFRSLLRLGFLDAAVERHKGWRMTWPRGHGRLPCLLRIDHILLSDNLQAADYQLGRGRGSDHRPVVADIACPPDAKHDDRSSQCECEVGKEVGRTSATAIPQGAVEDPTFPRPREASITSPICDSREPIRST